MHLLDRLPYNLLDKSRLRPSLTITKSTRRVVTNMRLFLLFERKILIADVVVHAACNVVDFLDLVLVVAFGGQEAELSFEIFGVVFEALHYGCDGCG